jgi:hypothetical protein
MRIDLQMECAAIIDLHCPEDGVSLQAVQCVSVIRIEREED